MFLILILFNSTCSPCLCKPFLNSICWRMWERKEKEAWLETLETFHDRCLVLILKLSLLTPSAFQLLNCWSEPKWYIYHPSVYYRCASVCVWLSGLWPNTWQPSTVWLSAQGQTSLLIKKKKKKQNGNHCFTCTSKYKIITSVFLHSKSIFI